MNLHFKICLYNLYVIVHLKSLKRQIFRNRGSNILGVYQNKSDFFQVCEQVLIFTTLDLSQRTGTLLVKGKGLPRSCRTLPTHARESGVLHGPSGMTHSLRKACCLAFSLSCGTAVEQTDYWQTAPRHRRVGKQKRGEDLAVARKPRNLVSDGARS